MKHLIILSLMLAGACSSVSIVSTKQVSVPAKQEKIAWSRAHSCIAQNDTFYFNRTNDYFINFTGTRFLPEYGDMAFEGIIIREWAASGFTYIVTIKPVNANPLRSAERDIIEESCANVCEKYIHYITGEK